LRGSLLDRHGRLLAAGDLAPHGRSARASSALEVIGLPGFQDLLGSARGDHPFDALGLVLEDPEEVLTEALDERFSGLPAHASIPGEVANLLRRFGGQSELLDVELARL